METWRVERHSGRSGDPYRVKAVKYDQWSARETYEKLARGLRQGAVRLVDPYGDIVDQTWAPRLRTRR